MARQFTKPIDLYKTQVARFRKMAASAKSGHEELAKAGYSDGHELTMGRVKTKTLRQLGHPFGRGTSKATWTPTGTKRGLRTKDARKLFGKSTIPTLPINRQTGRLRGSLYRRRDSGGIQSFVVGFSAPHAQYVLAVKGTERMVARGYWNEVVKRWRARNKALLDYIKELQAK